MNPLRTANKFANSKQARPSLTKRSNGNWSSSIFEVIDCCVKVNIFSPWMTR